MKVIPISHGSLYHQRTRNLPSVKTKFAPSMCKFPWSQINIDNEGFIFLCACDAWLPFAVGHILDFNSIDEIFSSPVAQEIQQSITDGNYKFCDTNNCFMNKGENLNDRLYRLYDCSIHLGIDASCNLQCPSCRPRMIFHDDDEYLKERHEWIDRIRSWIVQRPELKFLVTVGANGEPFASVLYRQFFATEFNPNVQYYIRSNATLIKKYITDLKLLPNLRIIEISLDAASAPVYEKVRNPGKWRTVVDNIDYLVELKKKYGFHMNASFVIQQQNLDDVLPFVDFCNERDIEPSFNLLQDWASFKDYRSECVHFPESPRYQEFLNIIHTEKFLSSRPHWIENYK